MSKGKEFGEQNVTYILYINLHSQNNKPFIVQQNSSGQEKYGGFLIDLIEELAKAANVRRRAFNKIKEG